MLTNQANSYSISPSTSSYGSSASSSLESLSTRRKTMGITDSQPKGYFSSSKRKSTSPSAKSSGRESRSGSRNNRSSGSGSSSSRRSNSIWFPKTTPFLSCLQPQSSIPSTSSEGRRRCSSTTSASTVTEPSTRAKNGKVKLWVTRVLPTKVRSLWSKIRGGARQHQEYCSSRSSRTAARRDVNSYAAMVLLNEDCLYEVLTFMHVNSLAKMMRTSRSWYQRTQPHMQSIARLSEAWNYSVTEGLVIDFSATHAKPRHSVIGYLQLLPVEIISQSEYEKNRFRHCRLPSVVTQWNYLDADDVVSSPENVDSERDPYQISLLHYLQGKQRHLIERINVKYPNFGIALHFNGARSIQVLRYNVVVAQRDPVRPGGPTVNMVYGYSMAYFLDLSVLNAGAV